MTDLNLAMTKEAEVALMNLVHTVLFTPYAGYLWTAGREAIECFDVLSQVIGDCYSQQKRRLPEPARPVFRKVATARLVAPLYVMELHRQQEIERYIEVVSRARIENLEQESELLPFVAMRNTIAIEREREHG